MSYIKPNNDKVASFLEDLEKGYLIYKDGKLFWTVSRKAGVIKPLKEPVEVKTVLKGYKVISKMVNGKRVQARQHRVIYARFNGLEALNEADTINHIDGNRMNNRIENLECVTREENEQHAILNGLKKRGSQHAKAKLTEKEVIEIKRMLKQGMKIRHVAKIYGVEEHIVGDIKRNRTWKHVG